MNREITVPEPTQGITEQPDGLRVERISTLNGPPENIARKLFKRLRWVLLGIIIALAIAAGLVATKVSQFKAMGAAAARQSMPPQPVNEAEVREEQWQPRISAVGSVMAFQGTIVSTEIDGIVREIKFEPGSRVNAGDELVQLDVEIQAAQLRAAEAAAEWAQISFKRDKELISSKAISQADLDSADSSFKQADAQVDNLRALIGKKTVRAPFAGKLGIRRISVGQFLEKGSPVVSLQSLDPVFVEFSLPQQRLGELKEGLTVVVSSDAYAGQQFEGKITAINPDIDSATRNVRVQATLSNADGRLRPGMFVSVDMVLGRSEKVLLIPATAVLHGPFGDSVFAVEEAKANANGAKSLVAQQRVVRLGARQGDFVVVTDGVKPGEQIVSTGVFKLRQGMPVVVDNTLAPHFALTPRPKNN
jgi:membrane fusion protein (multidrug efflux system)